MYPNRSEGLPKFFGLALSAKAEACAHLAQTS